MKKKLKYIAYSLFSIFLIMPFVANAQLDKATENLKKVGEGAYGKVPDKQLPEIVGQYISIFLGLLGIILVVLIVYGGYLWMTSMGSEEKVKKAKTLITDAVIGMIILLAAYAISNFVVTQLITATVG